MGKILKWVGIALGGLLVIIILAAEGLYASTSMRLNKTYAPPAGPISVPTDAAALSQGKHLVTIHCAVCHNADLSGSVIFQDPNLGAVTAPNIASGLGKDGKLLSDEELIRAIRYGVGSNGKPLFIMPSEAFYYLDDQDLGEMIAYLKSTKPVESSLPATSLKPLGMVLVGAGAFGKVIAAEEIDMKSPRPAAIEPGVTGEYGDYLVKTGECRTCHGEELTSGKDPDPNAPPAPNLTPGGELAGWSEADFLKAMRTGIAPGGRQLSKYMPWVFIGQMTDDELKATWLYLQSLPAVTPKK